jgi:alpha-1,2-mannosyltransferase
VLTLSTIATLAVVLRVFLRSPAWPLEVGGRTLAWLLPPALMLEPVRSTIIYGQVNVLLMALVTADCLAGSPRWPRGALTGLAAAVKLTPALFVLYFLLRRDYRAAGVTALSFLTATGLGFLLAPGDSARYWTRVVFDAGRIGDLAYAGNQSIMGMLARAGLDPRTPTATGIWLGLSVLVLVTASRGMRHAFAMTEDSLALALNAFAALLISPVSWSHHWVWAEPAVLALAVGGRQPGCRVRWQYLRTRWVAGVSGLVIFAASPQWWFPRGEVRWAVWQQAAMSSYAIFAALVLLLTQRMTLTPWNNDPWSEAAGAVEGGIVRSCGWRREEPLVYSDGAGADTARQQTPATEPAGT